MVLALVFGYFCNSFLLAQGKNLNQVDLRESREGRPLLSAYLVPKICNDYHHFVVDLGYRIKCIIKPMVFSQVSMNIKGVW